MDKARYKLTFLKHAGDGPWPCFFCKEEVTKRSLIVHHVDENRDNDGVSNLVPCHMSCHTSHHRKGKPLSKEHRENIGKANKGKLKGRTLSPEHREKMSKARRERIYSNGGGMTGHQHTEESRAKMSLALRGNQRARGKTLSAETRAKMSEAHRGKTFSLETRVRMSEAQIGNQNARKKAS